MPGCLTQSLTFALAGVCSLAACRAPRSVADQVSLHLPGGDPPIRLADVRIEPADNVQSARLDARGVLAIARVDQSRALQVSAPDMCPVRVNEGPQGQAQVLQPMLDLGGDRTGIGFGVPFTVTARHNCPPGAAQERGEMTWQQLEGPLLAQLELRDAGFALSAHTASFAALHPEPAAEGIIPISPRTQGRVVLEARWRGAGQASATRRLVISAAARATGLSSVAVSQPIVLAGVGWSVKAQPAGAHGSLKALEGLTFFTANAPGSWTLTRDQTHTLTLQVLTHDATPYDCGRSECHAALSEHAAGSAMSHALERPLDALADATGVSCMLDCHVLGERGLGDGGFLAVAERLGFRWTEHTRFQDLPQALRRAGSVRCTACHGPGAIPPPEQRSAILESDVCATCHDAPPRYVHVTQWREGRMASADREPETRRAPCARCHTTAGFLAHNGDRKLVDDAPRAEPSGIACAACHAPHSAQRGPRLIRHVQESSAPTGKLAPDPSASLCRACHAAAARLSDPTPSGSLFAAEIAVPRRDGSGWEPLRSKFVHEQVARGCVGCHGGGALETKAIDHSFHVEPRVCEACHADGTSPRTAADASAELRARALALSRALAPRCQGASGQSAHPQLAPARCSDSALSRARYEINLVLDDKSALVHNADLSRALLSDAERIVRGFQGF